jgi:hypothetical protein
MGALIWGKMRFTVKFQFVSLNAGSSLLSLTELVLIYILTRDSTVDVDYADWDIHAHGILPFV